MFTHMMMMNTRYRYCLASTLNVLIDSNCIQISNHSEKLPWQKITVILTGENECSDEIKI